MESPDASEDLAFLSKSATSLESGSASIFCRRVRSAVSRSIGVLSEEVALAFSIYISCSLIALRNLSTSPADNIPTDAAFSNSDSSSSDSFKSCALSTDGSIYSVGALTDFPGDMIVRK